MNILNVFAILFIIISCGQDNMKKRTRDLGYAQINQERSGRNTCSCAFEHSPVCGNDGKTYNNPCLASCHQSGGYNNGACSCNANSGYLCGQPPMESCPSGQACVQVMPAPKTYSDECVLLGENANFIHIGPCK